MLAIKKYFFYTQAISKKITERVKLNESQKDKKLKSDSQRYICGSVYVRRSVGSFNTCAEYIGYARQPRTPYVITRGLKKADVSEKKKYIAEVEAINSVDIIPQVSGYLEEILFEDGAEVKAGQKIFIIEQTQYNADLEKAEAAVKQLSKQYQRVSSLNKQKFASDKEIDLAESNLRQAKADLEIAKLNLEHSEIKSPITGRIGKAKITKGNYVSPSSGSLARVVQTNPIRIAFSVSDK